MRQSVHTRALRRAALILGSTEALREYLDVPMSHLAGWLEGFEPPPTAVFLKVVDLLLPVERPGGDEGPQGPAGDRGRATRLKA